MWGGLRLPDGAVLVHGMRGHAFRRENGGERWEEVAINSDQSLQAAISTSDGAVVMVGLGGLVATSRDVGRSFSAAIEPDRRGIAALAEGADDMLLLVGEAGIKERPLH